MIDEKLQFAISQYIDGQLPSEEVARLEARIASDARLQELVREYRELDRLLKQAAPTPQQDWEQMQRNISAAIAASEEPAPIPLVTPKPTWRWQRLALAASLLICAAIAVVTWRSAGDRAESTPYTADLPPSPSQDGYAIVTVLRPENVASEEGELFVQVSQEPGHIPVLEIGAQPRYFVSEGASRVLISALPVDEFVDEEFGILH